MKLPVVFYRGGFFPSVPLIRQVDPLQAQRAVEIAMSKWGVPQRMRFDNGYPFVNTADRTVPTALAIWLIALGIEVVANTPRRPEQNGSVECTQRISSRWANLAKCPDAASLQQALDQVAYEHIHVLRQRSKQDRTRAQQYPDLLQPRRTYRADDIDPQLVKDYLSACKWVRRVYQNGRISLFGDRWTIGTQYARQQAIICYNPIDNRWIVSLTNGQVISSWEGPNLDPSAIKNLTVFSKNLTT
jgi:hypothetical protein